MYLEISDQIVATCVGICEENEIPYENEADAIELVISLINVPRREYPPATDTTSIDLESLIEEELTNVRKHQTDELLKGVMR